MSEVIPEKIPPCAENLLARKQWFSDPGVVGRARIRPVNWLAAFLSSERFSNTNVRAITLCRTIYFRDTQHYDPHSPEGLALLAHELKHVEQYERDGLIKFYARYLWDYLKNRYSTKIGYEAEAYSFGRAVKEHLQQEFDSNPDVNPCQQEGEAHSPNPAFSKQVPNEFIGAT